MAVFWFIFSIGTFLFPKVLAAHMDKALSRPWMLEEAIFAMCLWPGLIGAASCGVGFFAVGAMARRRGDRYPLRLAASSLAITAGLWVLALPAFARAREKPVIYLYPEREQLVHVQLAYDGTLLDTIPDYGADGWRVIARPSGELTDTVTGTTYPYLFWEGKDTHRYALDTGFVVEGCETAAFLRSSLTTLGFTERETGDFIAYWLPRMTANPYNVIHFATETYAQAVPLRVNPEPDTMIRVLMVFEAVKKPPFIPPQRLEHKERHGFVLVEWGGTELRW